MCFQIPTPDALPPSETLIPEFNHDSSNDGADNLLEEEEEEENNSLVDGGEGSSSSSDSDSPKRSRNRSTARRSFVSDPLASSSSGLSPDFDKLGITNSSNEFSAVDDDSDYSWLKSHSRQPLPLVTFLPPRSPPLSFFRPAPRLPPPVGAGLANMGNTCFLNAVMQCFTHTVPLVNGLRSLGDDIGPAHHNDAEFCVLSAARDHIFRALAAPGDVISPYTLVDNLSCISSFFQRFQQEDAHEFLQCLLDKIDMCSSKCKVDAKGVSSEGDNLVKQVFGGRLVSQLYCCKCGSRSDTYEPLVDLSLEIEHVDDLDGAFKSFTKMEDLEDEVKISCEKCKEQVPVKKQLLLDQAPSVAALHLKRFKGDGYFVEKIDKALKYPLELDLKPYTVGTQDENVELMYELYAVIVHLGFSSISGHYLCYIRSSPDKWFRIDDSKVTAVSEETALSQQGYILFYARKGTPWPCSLVKESCDNGLWNTSPTSVLDIVARNSYSDPLRACLYDGNLVESKGLTEASTEHPQAFEDACCAGSSQDNGEGPSSRPRSEACTEKLMRGNSSSLTGALKDNEAGIFESVDAQVPIVTNDSSRKQKDNMLCNNDEEPSCRPRDGVCSEKLIDGITSSPTGASKENKADINGSVDAQGPILANNSSRKREYDMFCDEEFGDLDSSVRPTGNEAKSLAPSPVANIEGEINGLKKNVKILAPRSRSSSPDLYTEPEEHPETPRPQPLKKKLKVEKSASPRKAKKTMSAPSRKLKEAMKSINRLPASRRNSLLSLLQ